MNVGSALKPEYETAVAEDIKRGVEQFGHSREYWDYIRRLAIKYWAEWDRNKIFTIFAK
jgi:pyrimidine-specific ribonucleoside hydrolase